MHDIDAVGRPAAVLMIEIGAGLLITWALVARLRLVARRQGFREGVRFAQMTFRDMAKTTVVSSQVGIWDARDAAEEAQDVANDQMRMWDCFAACGATHIAHDPPIGWKKIADKWYCGDCADTARRDSWANRRKVGW